MFPVIDASRSKGKLKLISLVFGVSQQLPGIITPLPKQRREEQGPHCARFQVLCEDFRGSPNFFMWIKWEGAGATDT